jgi:GYF domain 2
MMAAAFKVRLKDGTEMGPLDLQMLRSWYQQGMVDRDSKVRASGGKQWVPLVKAVDIQGWGGAGGTRARGPREEAEDEEDLAPDPQRWRTFSASALFFLIAAGAAYFAWFPARWLPALREAPWREIALAQLLFAVMLVRGGERMRQVVRVLVFLMTFSLFAVAAPVLMQGLHWRALAILAAAWVMGSGLFFFLAARALAWTSVALCLFWIVAGAAGVGGLGFVPPSASAAVPAADPTLQAATLPWSASAAAVSRELPLLSPRAAEVIVSYGLDAPEAAFKKSYLLAANGVGRLSPQEARELGEITTALYAPIPAPSRHRLDGYMERVRQLQVTQPQEDREMSAIVRDAALQLPEPQRVRYQALYEKALGAVR